MPFRVYNPRKSTFCAGGAETESLILSLYRIRLLLDVGEHNVTGFSDAWAEPRYIEVKAASMEDAVCLLARDYPSQAGFVINSIKEVF